MRLFTGIDLTDSIRTRLERLISSLRPEALLRWSPIDNLHVTTKFIGDWPQERLAEVRDALGGIERRGPFSIELKGLGWFPNERSPRVLWCGVEESGNLRALAGDIDAAFVPLGISRDERPYTPHLTLARINHPVPLGRLRERVAELREVAVGTLAVSGVHLYESQPGSNGTRYLKLHTVNFGSAASAGNRA